MKDAPHTHHVQYFGHVEVPSVCLLYLPLGEIRKRRHHSDIVPFCGQVFTHPRRERGDGGFFGSVVGSKDKNSHRELTRKLTRKNLQVSAEERRLQNLILSVRVSLFQKIEYGLCLGRYS